MGTPLLLTEEFEVVIMIAVAIEEMHGSDRVPDLKGLQGEPWLVGTSFSTRAKWRALLRTDAELRCLTTPTLSERRCLQPLSDFITD